MSDESIKAPSAFNKILNPSVNYIVIKTRVKFNGRLFKTRQNLILSWKNSKHRYVNISSYSTLENCFFGAVKLTKHVDIDPNKYF